MRQVRCVKPNARLVSDSLDGAYVMRQLREMGMVHVVRARKQGFAHRYPFAKFMQRHADRLTHTLVSPSSHADPFDDLQMTGMATCSRAATCSPPRTVRSSPATWAAPRRLRASASSAPRCLQ